MYLHSYLQTATQIISGYNGSVPLAVHLKEFFRLSKKQGSRDRRIITHLCYSFFRLGRAFASMETSERIAVSVFLTAQEPGALLEAINPAWNEKAALSPDEKIALLDLPSDEWKQVFPLLHLISPEIDARQFVFSHWVQPDLFLRLRPGRQDKVKAALLQAGIPFSEPAPGILALPNGTKTDTLFESDRDAVVQDLSSARVLEPLQDQRSRPLATAWDCCAASGGKAILLRDQFPATQLTVSDVRKSILYNLQSRFNRAGIRQYRSFTIDLSLPGAGSSEKYDLVLCDAPCSGSGTWGRTPESLSFFSKEKLHHYSELQKKIAVNAAGSVNEGGAFLYITCSVYKEENEDVVAFIEKKTALRCRAAQYLQGFGQKADTLFVALLSL